MEKKYVIILVLSIIASFALGAGAHIGYVAINEDKQKEELSIRVNNGYVEWWDGKVWNKGEAVEILTEQDPYFIAEQELKAFEEEYRNELDSENQIALDEEKEVGQELNVGVEKTTSSSSAGASSSTTPAVGGYIPYVPVPSAPTTPTTPQPEIPVAPSTPSTGDGEDIGWSDDYL